MERSKMSLESEKQEIVNEAVRDIKSYKVMLSKWNRLGLEEDEFHLLIGEHKDSKYERKSGELIERFIDLDGLTTFGGLITELDRLKELGASTYDPIKIERRYYDSYLLKVTIEVTTESDANFSKRVRNSMMQRFKYASVSKEERDKEKAKKELERLARMTSRINKSSLSNLSDEEIIKAVKGGKK